MSKYREDLFLGASESLARVLERLDERGFEPKYTGRAGWVATCPAHSRGTKRRVWMRINNEGRAHLRCEDHCTEQQVVNALGLTLLDLMQGWSERPSRHVGNLITEFIYEDVEGRQVAAVWRRGANCCAEFHWDDGEWRSGLGGVDPPLYELPALAKANPNRTVFVVDSEMDADALCGQVVTTNLGGLARWREKNNEYFRDRTVILVPANNASSQDNARKVLAQLTGVARTVALLRLPGLPKGAGVRDWLEYIGNRFGLASLAYALLEQHAAAEKGGQQ